MQQFISRIALVVRDYDEAINWYTQKLNFRLIEDTVRSPSKRWVLIAPPGDSSTYLLLAKAKNEEQLLAVGNQTGGRVFLFLYTDDFDRDYQMLLDNEVEIVRPKSEEDFGKVCVFQDLYGNLWDFIQPKKPS